MAGAQSRRATDSSILTLESGHFSSARETLEHLALSVQQFGVAHGERAGRSIGWFGVKRGRVAWRLGLLFEVRFRDMGVIRS